MSDLERIKDNPVIAHDTLGYSDSVSVSETVQLKADKSMRPLAHVIAPAAMVAGSLLAIISGLWWIAAIMLPVIGVAAYKNIKSGVSLNGTSVTQGHREQLFTIAVEAESNKLLQQWDRQEEERRNRRIQEEQEWHKQSHPNEERYFRKLRNRYESPYYYGYRHDHFESQADSKLRGQLKFPKIWDKGSGLLLSEGIPSMDIPSVYAIKRADRKVDIVEQRFTSEDSLWMDSFEKALEVE